MYSSQDLVLEISATFVLVSALEQLLNNVNPVSTLVILNSRDLTAVSSLINCN